LQNLYQQAENMTPVPNAAKITIPLLLFALFAGNGGARAMGRGNTEIVSIPLSASTWTNLGADMVSEGVIRGTADERHYGSAKRSVTVDLDRTPFIRIEVSSADSGWYLVLSDHESFRNDYIQLMHGSSATGVFQEDVREATGLSGTNTFSVELGVVRLSGVSPLSSLSVTIKHLEFGVDRMGVRMAQLLKRPAESEVYLCDSFSVFGDRVIDGLGACVVDAANEMLVSDAYGTAGRRIPELGDGIPSVSTGLALFDALYRVAVEEARMNVRTDGALMAGAAWHDVWTRDACYSLYLALNLLMPDAARKSLEATVEDGVIVQDPRHVGWSSQTDRIVWLIAAWDYYCITGDEAFKDWFLPIAERSMDDAITTVLDTDVMLFRGESSFLDWGEQTYPAYMHRHEMARTKSTSINALYIKALDILAQLEARAGSSRRAASYRELSQEVRAAMNAHLWLPESMYYGYFLYDDGSLSLRSEGLGEALSVLWGIPGSRSRAESILVNTPVVDYGIPCIHPQHARMKPYHNLAVWPFVQAYWTWAAARYKHSMEVAHGIGLLMRCGAVFGTFKENTNMVDGGPQQVINSDRQLWSVAGFLSIPFRVFLGMEFEPEGIRLSPCKPNGFNDPIAVTGVRYGNSILDFAIDGQGFDLVAITLDGHPMKTSFIPHDLEGRHQVRITLTQGVALSRRNLKKAHFVSPEPVLDLSMEHNAGTATLTWSPVPDASEYWIYDRSTHLGRTATTRFATRGPDGEFLKLLHVVAIGAEGNPSDKGNSVIYARDTLPPSLPTGLLAKVGQSGIVSISWKAASDNLATRGYAVSRREPQSNEWTPVGLVNATAFSEAGLRPGAQWRYAVETVDFAGNKSAQSRTELLSIPIPQVKKRYEAEDGFCRGGPSIGGEHKGFSGHGYTEFFDTAGQRVGVWVNVRESRDHTLAVRAANGCDAPATRTVLIDGTTGPVMTFPETPGQWSRWTSQTASIELDNGIHLIELLYGTNDCKAINVDCLDLQ